LNCTILHLGLHIPLPGLDKIGWTAWLEYTWQTHPGPRTDRARILRADTVGKTRRNHARPQHLW